MRHPLPGSSRSQAALLRRQFLRDGDLPFATVLTEDVIAESLAAVGHWLDRVFSPLVTLWVFLGQVLSADHSCRAAAPGWPRGEVEVVDEEQGRSGQAAQGRLGFQ